VYSPSPQPSPSEGRGSKKRNISPSTYYIAKNRSFYRVVDKKNNKKYFLLYLINMKKRAKKQPMDEKNLK
jgi:hypothetical protein